MSLFKPLWGKRSDLNQKKKNKGDFHLCVDDGTIHVDYEDENGEIQRLQINANDAVSISGNTIDDIHKYVHQAIYGIVDGTIENITNDRASYIRDYAFCQHQNLTTANFSVAVEIGNYSFYKCPLLQSVNMPYSINIGVFAFKGCPSLTIANYPFATTIGQGAFDECTNLNNVNLPSLETVESIVFRKCESLSSIDLPVATTIKTQAFYSSGISSLTLRSNTVVALENADAFYFTPIENGTGYIYVPANLVDSYKSANNWSTYANQIRAIA